MTTTADASDDSTVAQLIQIVSDLQEIVKTQAERINELERELDNQSTNVADAFTKLGEITDRLDDLEIQQTTGGSPAETDENAGPNAEKPESTTTHTIKPNPGDDLRAARARRRPGVDCESRARDSSRQMCGIMRRKRRQGLLLIVARSSA